ncbi:uncharacterized protein [Miscanthus floridulus]|uniref:uncharacterized protein n=1 Tax=Miscanthus floridulus TaxID=154761 RepID=UPI00345AFFE2
MTTHIKSINRKIWQVVETKFEVANPKAPTTAEEEKLQNNDIALSVIHDAINQRVFEQIKTMEMSHDAWMKLEESYEGTQAVKGAKAYIFKEKFASFKMKENENVPEMFDRLQVLVNDLKELGEEGKAKLEESSDGECPSTCDEDDDEAMALFVKKFGKFMMKKGYPARRKKRSSKSKDEPRRCFKCNSKDHLIADCPHNSDNDDDKKIKKKGKKESKMTSKKKKKGGSYVVTWDSDASTSDDDSDDEKTSSKKKALASIAINNKPSLFDTPSTCLMAKATKVQSHDESDNNSDSDSDSDDEPTKDELIDMLEDAHEHFDIKRKECKELHKSNKTFEQSIEELKASQRG